MKKRFAAVVLAMFMLACTFAVPAMAAVSVNDVGYVATCVEVASASPQFDLGGSGGSEGTRPRVTANEEMSPQFDLGGSGGSEGTRPRVTANEEMSPQFDLGGSGGSEGTRPRLDP